MIVEEVAVSCVASDFSGSSCRVIDMRCAFSRVFGIVEEMITSIKDENQFIELCRKRSVFSDEKLKEQWNWKRNNRPFIVKFLYCYTFPNKINLKRLIELGIIKDVESVPRGFERISNESFEKIIKETNSNENIIVD